MSDLSFTEYQLRTADTAIYPESGSGSFIAVLYTLAGLANEAGEALGHFTKAVRDGGYLPGQPLPEEFREKLVKELGDVEWYWSQALSELGESTEVVAQANLDKLKDRKDRGKLSGSGDNR